MYRVRNPFPNKALPGFEGLAKDARPQNSGRASMGPSPT